MTDTNDENVVKLKPVYTPPGVPVPDIVSNLEKILEAAKRGEITDIAVACIHTDGNTGSFYTVTQNWAKLIGATEYVKHRVVLYGDS